VQQVRLQIIQLVQMLLALAPQPALARCAPELTAVLCRGLEVRWRPQGRRSVLLARALAQLPLLGWADALCCPLSRRPSPGSS
jgi:hypothetical protein